MKTKNKTRLWLGHEKEGDFLGLYTLFIGSCNIKTPQIIQTVKRYPKIEQLYFGAGLCTNINQSVVWKCLKEFPKLKIMLEVRLACFDSIDEDLFDKVNFILTINDSNLLWLKEINKKRVQFKLQSVDYDDKIVMLQNAKKFKYVDMTGFKGKVYSEDVVLE